MMSKTAVVKYCKYCGAKFETFYHKKKFCSLDCKMKNYAPIQKQVCRAYYERKKKFAICRYCGKEFETSKYLYRYCSFECKYKNIYKKARIREALLKKSLPKSDYNFDEEKVCSITGKVFTLKYYVARRLGIDEKDVSMKNLSKTTLKGLYSAFRRSKRHPVLSINLPSLKMSLSKRCFYCNKHHTSKTVIREQKYFCDDTCFALYVRLKSTRGKRTVLHKINAGDWKK